jgi:hypothetical protein
MIITNDMGDPNGHIIEVERTTGGFKYEDEVRQADGNGRGERD